MNLSCSLLSCESPTHTLLKCECTALLSKGYSFDWNSFFYHNSHNAIEVELKFHDSQAYIATVLHSYNSKVRSESTEETDRDPTLVIKKWLVDLEREINKWKERRKRDEKMHRKRAKMQKNNNRNSSMLR